LIFWSVQKTTPCISPFRWARNDYGLTFCSIAWWGFALLQRARLDV